MPVRTRPKPKGSQSSSRQRLPTQFGELETTPTSRQLLLDSEKTSTGHPGQQQTSKLLSAALPPVASAHSQNQSDGYDDDLDDSDFINLDDCKEDAWPSTRRNFTWSEAGSMTRRSSPVLAGETPQSIWQFGDEDIMNKDNGEGDSLMGRFSSPKPGTDTLPDTAPILQDGLVTQESEHDNDHRAVDFSETASTEWRSSPFGPENVPRESWDFRGGSSVGPLSSARRCHDEATYPNVPQHDPERPIADNDERYMGQTLGRAKPPVTDRKQALGAISSNDNAFERLQEPSRQRKKAPQAVPKRSHAVPSSASTILDSPHQSQTKYGGTIERPKAAASSAELREEYQTPSSALRAGFDQPRVLRPARKRKQRAKPAIQFDEATLEVKDPEPAQEKRQCRMPIVSRLQGSARDQTSTSMEVSRIGPRKSRRKGKKRVVSGGEVGDALRDGGSSKNDKTTMVAVKRATYSSLRDADKGEQKAEPSHLNGKNEQQRVHPASQSCTSSHDIHDSAFEHPALPSPVEVSMAADSQLERDRSKKAGSSVHDRIGMLDQPQSQKRIAAKDPNTPTMDEVAMVLVEGNVRDASVALPIHRRPKAAKAERGLLEKVEEVQHQPATETKHTPLVASNVYRPSKQNETAGHGKDKALARDAEICQPLSTNRINSRRAHSHRTLSISDMGSPILAGAKAIPISISSSSPTDSRNEEPKRPLVTRRDTQDDSRATKRTRRILFERGSTLSSVKRGSEHGESQKTKTWKTMYDNRNPSSGANCQGNGANMSFRQHDNEFRANIMVSLAESNPFTQGPAETKDSAQVSGTMPNGVPGTIGATKKHQGIANQLHGIVNKIISHLDSKEDEIYDVVKRYHSNTQACVEKISDRYFQDHQDIYNQIQDDCTRFMKRTSRCRNLVEDHRGSRARATQRVQEELEERVQACNQTTSSMRAIQRQLVSE